MKIYKSLERRSYVLGLPLQELGLLICLFMLSVLGGSLAGIVMKVPLSFYLLSILFISGLYLLLRRAARQKHPSFLLSYISYHFFQAKHIGP